MENPQAMITPATVQIIRSISRWTTFSDILFQSALRRQVSSFTDVKQWGHPLYRRYISFRRYSVGLKSEMCVSQYIRWTPLSPCYPYQTMVTFATLQLAVVS